MLKRTVRNSDLTHQTAGPQLGYVGRDLREIFEIDRYTLVVQLKNLRREIADGAEEMRMVAAERVFRESLSGALVKQAEKLQVTVNELSHLMRSVERAKMPKVPGRPESKAAARHRQRKRN